MTLVTRTRSPPSWAAMLPQKFSAATTCSLPAGPPEAAPEPHPEADSASAAGTAMARVRTTSVNRRARRDDRDISPVRVGDVLGAKAPAWACGRAEAITRLGLIPSRLFPTPSPPSGPQTDAARQEGPGPRDSSGGGAEADAQAAGAQRPGDRRRPHHHQPDALE